MTRRPWISVTGPYLGKRPAIETVERAWARPPYVVTLTVNAPVSDIHPTRQEQLMIENLGQAMRCRGAQNAMLMLPAEIAIHTFYYADHRQ